MLIALGVSGSVGQVRPKSARREDEVPTHPGHSSTPTPSPHRRARCQTVSAAIEVEAGGLPPAGKADVWLVGTDGRGRTRLTDGLGASFSPVFSVDGRVYFTRRCRGSENIWSLLPPSTPRPGTILSGQQAGGSAASGPLIGAGSEGAGK